MIVSPQITPFAIEICSKIEFTCAGHYNDDKRIAISRYDTEK